LRKTGHTQKFGNLSGNYGLKGGQKGAKFRIAPRLPDAGAAKLDHFVILQYGDPGDLADLKKIFQQYP